VARRHRNARGRILEATWRRLEAGDPARLEDVAADAGVSRQAIYLHFGSRGGLLLALVTHIDERLGIAGRLARARALGDPVVRLEATVAAMVRYEREIHPVAMALTRLAATDPEIQTALEDRMARRRRTLARVVADVAEQGRLRCGWSPGAVTDALWELSAPSTYEHLVVERGWPLERFEAWVVWAARSLVT